MNRVWCKILKGGVGAVLLALLTVRMFAFEESGVRSAPPMKYEVPTEGVEFAGSKLPFTFKEIATYFATALETQPRKVEGKCVVFTRSESNGVEGFHETVMIVVTSVEDDLSVTLLTNADYGVNYFREFIESRYFFPEESEQLYYLLHNAPSVQWKELIRFRVQLNVMQTADWEIIGLTFSPRSLFDLQTDSHLPLPPED